MDSFERFCLFFRVIGVGGTSRQPRKIISFECTTLEFYLKLAIVFSDAVLLMNCIRTIYYFLDLMGAVNDLIKYTATVFTTSLILIEAHLKAHKLWQLNKLANEFQQEIMPLINHEDLLRSNRRFWWKYKIKFFAFTAFFVTTETVLVPLYMTNEVYKSSITLLIGNNLFIIICRYRHLQHVLYMELVRYELELIVKVLSNSQGLESGKRLHRLQNLYMKTVEMVELQNEYFGLSQGMNLVFNHLQLLGDAYWTYWRYIHGCCTPGSISEFCKYYKTIETVRILSRNRFRIYSHNVALNPSLSIFN